MSHEAAFSFVLVAALLPFSTRSSGTPVVALEGFTEMMPLPTMSEPENARFATPEATEGFVNRMVSQGTAISPFYRMSKSGLALSTVGIGTYLGKRDAATDELVRDAIIQSVRAGWNVIDTAVNYRAQRGERSVGAALNTLFNPENRIKRAELFIATKAGFLGANEDPKRDLRLIVKEDPQVAASDVVQGKHCIAPRCLEISLNHSLGNLGLPAVDLLYLHNAAEKQLPVIARKEFLDRLLVAFTHLEKEVANNRIGAYGMATAGSFLSLPSDKRYLSLEEVVQLAQRAAKAAGRPTHSFRYVQLPLNLQRLEGACYKNQPVAGEMLSFLAAAAKLGVEVISNNSINKDRITRETRAKLDMEFLQVFLNKNEKSEVWGTGARMLQVTRSLPGLLTSLVGHKHPAHVLENLQVGREFPLKPEQMEQGLGIPTDCPLASEGRDRRRKKPKK